MALDARLDLLGGRDDRVDLVAQFLAQRVDGVEIKRIGQRDAQVPALDRERHDRQPMHSWLGTALTASSGTASIFSIMSTPASVAVVRRMSSGVTDRSHQFLDRAMPSARRATCILHVGGLDQAVLDQ